jgi:hypothetical protein
MKKLILISLILLYIAGAVAQTGSVVVTVKNIDINIGGIISPAFLKRKISRKSGKR